MLISSLLLILGGAYMPYTAAAQSSCWRNTPCSGQAEPSFSGAWEQYNLSPSSRTVSPIQILNSDNTFLSKFPGPATLKGNGSLLIFDFGQEVGGIVTVTYNATGTGVLGLAFTESKNWTGVASDDSNGSFGPDGALTANVTSTENGSYTMPDNKLRGGFRYLTLFTTTNSSISVGILSITLEISFQPAWSNLRAYGGYFSSNDDLINRIWYAGAYTLQTNAISPNSGRQYPLVATGWENDAYLGTNGTSTFVDGSKRDRAVWAGDLCVAVPSILVSIGDSDGVKNAMQTQYDYQQTDGNLPMVGPPINFYDSDTYHMSTMIATYDYILHSNDITFLTGIWTRYKLAMTYVIDKIDSTGLFNCTGTGDWGRYAQGGHNSEANMLMYQTLITGSSVAGWAGEPDLSSTWKSLAATLKSAVNTANWDPAVGAFKDSDIDASVHPEDGNSMALLFNVANSSYTQSISKQLTTNWNSIGAVCPELPNNIVGYVESFEVKGHLAARQATRALDLMRLSWGWYLNNPEGTGSSTPEGYLADGTFGYRATTGYNNDYSYTSHAHGWSTGPTHALTYYVVGLQLVAPAGSEWLLAPQFGDLTNAEGGFTTPLGLFSASWLLNDGGYSLSYNMPDSSSGTLMLPASATAVLKVDGVVKEGDYNATSELISISGEGGEHNITLTY